MGTSPLPGTSLKTLGPRTAMSVPSLSTLDGWWIEGCVEGLTGWGIEGEAGSDEELARLHAENLYHKLETAVLPTYRHDPERWATIMRSCIALNGPYFNTQRMVRDYVVRAYL